MGKGRGQHGDEDKYDSYHRQDSTWGSGCSEKRRAPGGRCPRGARETTTALLLENGDGGLGLGLRGLHVAGLARRFSFLDQRRSLGHVTRTRGLGTSRPLSLGVLTARSLSILATRSLSVLTTRRLSILATLSLSILATRSLGVLTTRRLSVLTARSLSILATRSLGVLATRS